MVHSGESSVAPVALTAKAKALLPPGYTVSEQADGEAATHVGMQTSSGGIRLGIDPDMTRIHRPDGQAVEVRSLTLEQKRRRKRIRVAIVYVISVVVLVVWFIWLLGRFE